MDIHAGDQVITGAEVFSERVWYMGTSRPSMRVQLSGALSDAQLEALTSQPLELYDGDELLGRHEGYDTVVRHELTLAMVTSQEQLEQAAQEAEQQAQQAKQAAQTMRAAVADLVPQIADSPLMINILTPALPEWKPGAFNAGDVRTFNGAPYKCVQSHDSTDNPDWTPDATPALWIQYHGTSPDTARPWVQPTGAHDMYKAGEYMIWTDGKIYRCLSDTNFSPAEYAQAWDDWEG